MGRRSDRVDHSGFALRKRVRDSLRPVLVSGTGPEGAVDDLLEELEPCRDVALRQIFGFFREGRIADEIAALDLVGRLATEEDRPLLERIVQDTAEPEAARVTAALVLLGHDALAPIADQEISRLVLRWQARFLAEEPGLRPPLQRLYRSAPPPERAAWIALQDQELGDSEGRAAVFEMLLEAEDHPELRRALISALAAGRDPAVRAALRRVRTRSPAERDLVTGALARHASEAETDRVPDGWSARVGFCDGTGSFPLRFDFRLEGRRPRTALFVLNHGAGVREALALTGLDVRRYDGLAPADEPDGPDCAGEMMVPIPVPLALALLIEAERFDRRERHAPPDDYEAARRLLDPLADLRPLVPEPRRTRQPAGSAAESARLLDHEGYAGWFYDAGDHALDDVRLEALDALAADDRSVCDALIDRAAGRLAAGGEPQRLARMLRHNALVHEAAGEARLSRIAQQTARRLERGEFAAIPLVRRMIRESLHPGHYFLTPIPDLPERHDLAQFVLDGRRPTRGAVFAVDLAFTLSRAFEVWLSRVPCVERPHGDQIQQTTLGCARAGARAIQGWFGEVTSPESGIRLGDDFGPFGDDLRQVYRAALSATGLPRARWDEGHGFLLDLLVQASEALLFRVCLGPCPGRCLLEPRRSGAALLRPGVFPAGREAEVFLRSWPGPFLHAPSRAQQKLLDLLIRQTEQALDDLGELVPPDAECYVCGVCGEQRPRTTLSRSRLVPHDLGEEPRPVCRRCQGRYRRDARFRAATRARLGQLFYT
ncbi:MAG: hypothetical protein D6738_11785 [Acidobacteria bacterium]|nr:MAG: hypothetical protein D6738_11785 [Acidobacteriota bacterium]